MEIISEKDNKLMGRKEAWLMLEHEGKPTPPRKDILADVAKHFKAKEDCVIVDKIFSEAGRAASRIKVLVYPRADAVPKAKRDKMEIRMGLKKADEKADVKEEKGKDEGESKEEEKPAEDGAEKSKEESKE